ncbi:3-dehydroquinate synthase [Megalodesulfovibrio paquesii]
MDRIDITLPAKAPAAYAVEIVPGLLDTIGERLAPPAPHARQAWAVVSDDTVAAHYGRQLLASLERAGLATLGPILTFPPGEQHKRLATVEALCTQFLTDGLARDGGVIALGGGLVGDVAGLAAALYMRGVPCVQVPTTLLAMIDASVGGKTAVNLGEAKNCLGRFHQPAYVGIDPQTLATLPDDEFASGLGELAKYAMLDETFHGWVQQEFSEEILPSEPSAPPCPAGASTRGLRLPLPTLAAAIAHCVRIKAGVVMRDELEAGERMVLNYGHTFGHGLETLLKFAKPHGWCVAQGMRLAAMLSLRLGLCDDSLPHMQDTLLKRLGLFVPFPRISPQALIEAMRTDKKKHAGSLTFILPRAVGRLEVVRNVPEEDVLQAVTLMQM